MILPMFPLLLTIVVTSIIWYQKSSHELSRVLAAGAAIVCLIWGFAVAHWSFHLLSLVFLFKLDWLLATLGVESSQ
ncbi:MAG: hypothetical protein SAL07_25185 [Oscillatoria sp. PMC 1051.18]|uniref:hypothetical protein n=1 Tax=Oscillatoria salina TaxID=331517 RepID=UPI0013B81C53|nr:hypothetical protein [Oscillatoria salina]MBZ8178842.1 hypothetical protein [Oscillatoria salina IIICB1]MEC4896262.1 hypothetical protein [Oscillatoria sp. PMC 1050.18]MEC5033202.1 hypothetical protein [Oscillatoria sp. PMC 1051.18]NET87615.1 hypothetical protein [Kamptonema sp. SIO1D9]